VLLSPTNYGVLQLVPPMEPSSSIPPPLLHLPPPIPPLSAASAASDASAPSDAPVDAPLATTGATAATTAATTISSSGTATSSTISSSGTATSSTISSSSTSSRKSEEHARGMASAVTVIQVESLERILRSASDTLKDMAKVAAALQKLTRDADRAVAALQPRPTEDERSRRRGLHASLAETCGGLRLVADSYCNELRLKQQLVAAITYNTPSSDIAAILAVLEDEPCIDSSQ
ncbi:unnamed protein product, partial [Closterium sp. Naga37s-1]